MYLTNYWGFSLHYFCNDIKLLHGIQTTKNHPLWCSGWSGMEIVWSNSRAHAAANLAGCPQSGTVKP
eukprot:937415-Pelagomonas_calceolata.AAC.3